MAQSDVSVVVSCRHLHGFVAFVLVVHFATFFVTCKWWKGLRCMVAQMQALGDVRNVYCYQWQLHTLECLNCLSVEWNAMNGAK